MDLTPFTDLPVGALIPVHLAVYIQGNQLGSRKKLLPLVRAQITAYGDGTGGDSGGGGHLKGGSVSTGTMSERDTPAIAGGGEDQTPGGVNNVNQNGAPSRGDGSHTDLLAMDPLVNTSTATASPAHPPADGNSNLLIEMSSGDLLGASLSPSDPIIAQGNHGNDGAEQPSLLDFGDFEERYVDPEIHVNVIRESNASHGFSDLDFSPGASVMGTNSQTKDLLAELDPFAYHTGVLMERSPDQLATPELRSSESSHPATPPGSPCNGESAFGTHSQVLPSFNSSEMVQKIREKKASMGDAILEEDEEEGELFGDKPKQASQDSDHEDPDKFPFTPQNSITESDFDNFVHGAGLPSFNSSEMVQKIQHKKASLSGVDEEDNGSIDKSEDPSRYPFTPQNSLQEHKFDSYAKGTNLPSFNSSAMLERIREKKAELEAMTGIIHEEEKEEEGEGDEPGDCPFTPTNSVGESSLDDYANQHSLPSFHNTEMLDKIAAKRTSLGDYESDDLNEAKKHPFTPPNSLDIGDAFPAPGDSPSKTPLSPDDLWSKLESGGEVFSHSGDALPSDELPTETVGNVVAFSIAQRMREAEGGVSGGDTGPDEEPGTATAGNVIAYRIAEDMRRLATEDRSEPYLTATADTQALGVDGERLHTHTKGNVVAHRIAQDMKAGVNGDVISTPLATSQADEIEIARGVAHAIIQDALDNFDLIEPVASPESKSPARADVSTNQGGEWDSCESDVTASGSFTSSGEVEPASPLDLLETNYMPGLDPLRDSSGIANIDLATNVDKVIAEESSFEQNRRESCVDGDTLDSDRIPVPSDNLPGDNLPGDNLPAGPSQVEMSSKKVVGFASSESSSPEMDLEGNYSNNNNEVECLRTDVADQVVSKAMNEAVEIYRQESEYTLPPPASTRTHASTNASSSSMLGVPGGRPRCVSPAPGTTHDSSRLEAIMAIATPGEPVSNYTILLHH